MKKSLSSLTKDKKTIALIPSAGSPPIEMQAEFGQTPTAFLPLGKSIALVELLSRIHHHFDEIFVGLKDVPPAVEKLILKQFPHVQIHVIEHSRSIGETILALAQAAGDPEGYHMYVQLGDSLHEFNPPDRTTFYYSISSHPYKWVSFDLINGKTIANIKAPTKEHSEVSRRIFSGQFFFTEPKVVLDSIEQYIAPGHFETDPFFRACEDLSQSTDVNFISKDIANWSDFGYLSSYHTCKKHSVMNSREFNSIEFVRKKNTLIKRSRNKEKFLSEIRWFSSLPPFLAYLHPRVYSIDDSADSPSIELEYLPSTPLDQLYLYTSADLYTWKKISSHVSSAIKEMQTHSDATLDRVKCCREMYIAKTFERINAYLHRKEFAVFHQDSIRLNGSDASGLSALVHTLENYVEKYLVGSLKQSTVIHGDLCFSNILYDLRSDHIKLIDPRGSFGQEGNFGDPRYDLAKLRHSALSHYDFLANGLFSLSIQNSDICLEIPRTKRQEQVSKYFEEVLQGLAQDHHVEVLLIEVLLFLSMVPLHNDRPESQKAYIATGLMLFNQFLKEVTEE